MGHDRRSGWRLGPAGELLGDLPGALLDPSGHESSAASTAPSTVVSTRVTAHFDVANGPVDVVDTA